MIGNNTFVFNTATMIEILQEWFDSNLSDTPTVTGVKMKTENSCNLFEITVESKKLEISDV